LCESYGNVEVGTAYEEGVIFYLFAPLTLTQTRNLVVEWLCRKVNKMNVDDPILIRCDIHSYR
jgi:hypothetical protein